MRVVSGEGCPSGRVCYCRSVWHLSARDWAYSNFTSCPSPMVLQLELK